VLFLLIHLTLKIVISKNVKPPLHVVIIAATKKKPEKKIKNQNPILYIHFNFGGNDKKKVKKEKTFVLGHFDTYKTKL
jgi:hypothetical protein